MVRGPSYQSELAAVRECVREHVLEDRAPRDDAQAIREVAHEDPEREGLCVVQERRGDR